jgi:hypothetical protein
MYGYDKELIIEALMSYAENQIIPEGDLQNNKAGFEFYDDWQTKLKASRLREIAGFIDKTPTCPGEEPQSNTSFQQCMAEKLRGHEHQGRALHGFARVEAAKAAFIKAAHECASGAQPKPTESELLDEAFKVFGLLKVIGVV